MNEESGTFDVGKLRGNRILLPLAILVPLIIAAVGWGATQTRVQNLEQQQLEARQERERMEAHLANDDEQITILKQQLAFIIEQLRAVNAKLDRAEEERHK